MPSIRVHYGYMLTLLSYISTHENMVFCNSNSIRFPDLYSCLKVNLEIVSILSFRIESVWAVFLAHRKQPLVRTLHMTLQWQLLWLKCVCLHVPSLFRLSPSPVLLWECFVCLSWSLLWLVLWSKGYLPHIRSWRGALQCSETFLNSLLWEELK